MLPILDKLKAFLQPRPIKLVGDKLYLACVNQARNPRFYLDYGIADEIGSRFELLTFHVGLIVTMLKSVTSDQVGHEQAQEAAQALFDAFLLALDSTLREQGTGDLTVPKKMKKLGIVIYTRMKRWDDLWKARADLGAQANYAARTIYAGAAYADDEAPVDDSIIHPDILIKAMAFAAYADVACEALQPDDLLQGRLLWPVPTALVSDATFEA